MRCVYSTQIDTMDDHPPVNITTRRTHDYFTQFNRSSAVGGYVGTKLDMTKMNVKNDR